MLQRAPTCRSPRQRTSNSVQGRPIGRDPVALGGRLKLIIRLVFALLGGLAAAQVAAQSGMSHQFDSPARGLAGSAWSSAALLRAGSSAVPARWHRGPGHPAGRGSGAAEICRRARRRRRRAPARPRGRRRSRPSRSARSRTSATTCCSRCSSCSATSSHASPRASTGRSCGSSASAESRRASQGPPSRARAPAGDDEHPTDAQDSLVDTSAIIDGRIADVMATGFIDRELVIPVFVLLELQRVADSPGFEAPCARPARARGDARPTALRARHLDARRRLPGHRGRRSEAVPARGRTRARRSSPPTTT